MLDTPSDIIYRGNKEYCSKFLVIEEIIFPDQGLE